MIQYSSLLSPLCCLLIFSTVATSTYTACDDCTDRANTSELAKIELLFYPNNSFAYYTTVLANDASDLADQIDCSKPTALYISGWTESPTSTSVETVLNAYFQRNDHNILLVDYSEIAAQEWDYASASAEGVGFTLAAALDKMTEAGFDSSGLHVVGHSLGGQVSGFVGRYASSKVPRITGLDPAGPAFSSDDDHLSSSDADFVDIIHTDAGTFGINYSAGTADFYPNGGGSPQPGCENDFELLAAACSHYRSWIYYAESLVDEAAFLAVACESNSAFEAGSCSGNATVVMGYATPRSTSGNFDLQTNSASPYGRKEAGVTYEE